jgi:hypothetical protein
MIVQEERDGNISDQDSEFEGELVEPQPGALSWVLFLHMHHTLRDRTTHDRLQADLVKHMWIHVETKVLCLI